jgi:phosphatidylglycerophosphate synthase
MVATTTENTPHYRESRRELNSLLAPLEKRCLIWMAERMPARINSDHLTILALVSIVGAGASFWLAQGTPASLALVVVCLALNWFGDSLDGTLARVRRQPRPRYGFYVDHVVDAVGAVFLFGGMGLSGYMNPMVSLVLLVAYLLLMVETFLATHTLGTFKMSHFMIGPTELRVLLAIGTLVLLVHPMSDVFGHQYRLFDIGGVVAACGMVFTLAMAAFTNTRALYAAEPLPRRQGSR